MNTLIKTILLSGMFIIAPAAFGAPMYFDIGLGNASVEAEEEGIEVDGSDTYLRIAVGADLSSALSVEGGYWDLGEASDTVFGTDVSAAADGLFGDVKGRMKLNSDTELYGKIGLFLWDAEICADGLGCASDDGNDLFYGGGVTFQKVGPGNINLEVLMTSLDDVDVTTFGGSYSIPFGK